MTLDLMNKTLEKYTTVQLAQKMIRSLLEGALQEDSVQQNPKIYEGMTLALRHEPVVKTIHYFANASEKELEIVVSNIYKVARWTEFPHGVGRDNEVENRKEGAYHIAETAMFYLERVLNPLTELDLAMSYWHKKEEEQQRERTKQLSLKELKRLKSVGEVIPIDREKILEDWNKAKQDLPLEYEKHPFLDIALEAAQNAANEMRMLIVKPIINGMGTRAYETRCSMDLGSMGNALQSFDVLSFVNDYGHSAQIMESCLPFIVEIAQEHYSRNMEKMSEHIQVWRRALEKIQI